MAKEKNQRFETRTVSRAFTDVATILIDKETGVNYLFYQSGYAGGLTPLLDSNGNVVVTPVYSYEEE